MAMSQHDYVIDNASGAAVRADLNLAFGAIATLNAGGSAPGTTYAYMLWADTAAGILKQRNSANTAWVVRDRLESEGVVAKTSAYTVDLADHEKCIVATSGTWTLTLTAAATLGDGFYFAFRNAGSGTITIDGDGSETIDGATTLTIYPGESCVVYCNGTLFRTVGLPPVFTGDSGSGGRRGLVPAPASGDAAAGYSLLASGSFGVPKFGVRQIETLIKTDKVSATSEDAWADISGFSITFSNAILDGNDVEIDISIMIGATGANSMVGFRVLRNSTVVHEGDAASNRFQAHAAVTTGAATNLSNVVPLKVYDVDPGAGAHTYKVQWRIISAQTMVLNASGADSDNEDYSRGVSTIIAKEIQK